MLRVVLKSISLLYIRHLVPTSWPEVTPETEII